MCSRPIPAPEPADDVDSWSPVAVVAVIIAAGALLYFALSSMAV